MIKTINPKVSIIIPVFNGSNYLKNAIDSALDQTYQNIEILVINDGSFDDDQTEKIALSYGDKITYLKKENGGVASALNVGLMHMSGDYFSWLSHDDMYYPDKIEVQMKYMQNNCWPATILYSDFDVFRDCSDVLKRYSMPKVAPQNFRYAILTASFINGCTLLIPKAVFDEIGLFDIGLRHTQDYDYWFKAAKKIPFQYVNHSSVKSRVHEHQDSNKYQKDAQAEIESMLAKFILDLSDQEITSASGKLSAIALSNLMIIFSLRGLNFAAMTAEIEARKKAVDLSTFDYSKVIWRIYIAKIQMLFGIEKIFRWIKKRFT